MWVDPIFPESSVRDSEGSGRIVFLTESPTGGRTIPELSVERCQIDGDVIIRVPALPLGERCPGITLEDSVIKGSLYIELLGWAQKIGSVFLSEVEVYGTARIFHHGMGQEAFMASHLQKSSIRGQFVLKNQFFKPAVSTSSFVSLSRVEARGDVCMTMSAAKRGTSAYWDVANATLQGPVAVSYEGHSTHGLVRPDRFDLRPF